MGYQFFVPGTEYGGLIQNMQVQEGDDSAVFTGDTWRGMMMDKIIEPPAGQDYLTVSGDANTIIATLLEGRFGSLITAVPSESGINVVNYQFDRYISLLDGIMKMLATKNARLNIKYVQGEPGAAGHVEVGAVEVQDLSETDEYSQDTKVRFAITEINNGINHLICLGAGELKDRQVVHLYADADGNISQTKTFTGLDERAATYDYSNAESIDELIKGGTDRLKELISYQSFEMQIDQTVADIGDIVGGREYTTGFVIKQQITQKILTANNGGWSVEFKVGGIVKQSSGVGGGGATVNVIDDDNVSENTTFSSQKITSDFWEKSSGSRIIEKITVENIGTLSAGQGKYFAPPAWDSTLYYGIPEAAGNGAPLTAFFSQDFSGVWVNNLGTENATNVKVVVFWVRK